MGTLPARGAPRKGAAATVATVWSQPDNLLFDAIERLIPATVLAIERTEVQQASVRSKAEKKNIKTKEKAKKSKQKDTAAEVKVSEEESGTSDDVQADAGVGNAPAKRPEALRVKEKTAKQSVPSQPRPNRDPGLELKIQGKLEAMKVERSAKSEHKREKRDRIRELKKQPRKPAAVKPAVQSKQGETVRASAAAASEKEEKNAERVVQEDIPELEFNVSGLDQAKRRRVVKKRDLPGLIERAERKQARLQEGGDDVLAAKVNKAIKKAGGEKLLDDPKLLKRTLKNQERQKRKSEREWGKRLAEQKAQQKDRVAKREANIQKRVASIKAKKSGTGGAKPKKAISKSSKSKGGAKSKKSARKRH
ncbi:hypothetical protein FVE85_2529 [Porphyridium purpureum]|uniref:Ribosomal RNA-processing protein 14/surfeit locus protein 6 C-terminal domain-containing protein n=1 Tax=Porphyridium purpureum TaxID=35688 RepID=A0A5J4YLE9_PORPP|nr:hypothetical protein FVE85_2529 [Porphyridium purpureum]|eukprot:POR0264..scf291_13